MAAPESFCGHRGGKMRFWGARIQKSAEYARFLHFFPFDGGGADSDWEKMTLFPLVVPPLNCSVSLYDSICYYTHIWGRVFDYTLLFKIYQICKASTGENVFQMKVILFLLFPRLVPIHRFCFLSSPYDKTWQLESQQAVFTYTAF